MLQEKKNKLEIDSQPLEITAKRLTFFDVQAVAPLLMDGTMDFSQYWRHAFIHWLTYSDPDGNVASLNIDTLSPMDGAKLSALLPQPSEVMEWLVFREAKSETSKGSSTGDQ